MFEFYEIRDILLNMHHVLPVWAELLGVLYLGLALGSFTTAITHRELNDQGWLFPKKGQKMSRVVRSECPKCGHALSVLDLIPLLSWVFLKGRCRYCRAEIGAFYPLIELGVLAACFLAYWALDYQVTFLAVIVCLPFLTALMVVDFQRMILPNLLVLFVALLGVLWLGLMVALQEMSLMQAAGHVSCAFLYGGMIWLLGVIVGRVLKKDALGGGDVKFFAAAGVWLGPMGLPAFCILSGVLGVILGAIWQYGLKKPVFPFGPALIVSLFVMQLFGSFFQGFM